MHTVARLRHLVSKSPLRIPLFWYRHRGLEPADAFFASYPRSGKSWFLFLFYESLTGREPSFGQHLYQAIPDIGGQALAGRLLPGRGRLIGSHERYRKEYKKAVYLVRDVRDVVLSEFDYFRFRGLYDCDFETFLRLFLRGALAGHGDWRGHVESWLNSGLAAPSNFHLIRYEDARKDPAKELSAALVFLGAEIPAERVRRAVENNSLEKMRIKEDRAGPGAFRSAQPGERFVRKGRVGDWREDLSPSQLEALEEYAGGVLRRLGYPVTPGAE